VGSRFQRLCRKQQIARLDWNPPFYTGWRNTICHHWRGFAVSARQIDIRSTGVDHGLAFGRTGTPDYYSGIKGVFVVAVDTMYKGNMGTYCFQDSHTAVTGSHVSWWFRCCCTDVESLWNLFDYPVGGISRQIWCLYNPRQKVLSIVRLRSSDILRLRKINVPNLETFLS
jgi:hypothetical protein